MKACKVFYITKCEEYWRCIGVVFFVKLWMKTILTILMQLQDFKCIKHRGSIKKASNLAKLDTVFW